MDLIIGKRIVDAPIDKILNDLKKELTNGLLKDIGTEKNGNIAVTCPVHKGGHETHPSCNVYCRSDSKSVEYGRVHCFTCGYSASLPEFIGYCFNQDSKFGEDWLVSNYSSILSDSNLYLPPIEIEHKKDKVEFMDDSVLDSYEYYHDYMWQRGLSKEVVDRFRVGYDDDSKSITFPIWDEFGRLVMITRRNVARKRFNIEESKYKPVYLMNFIIKDSIDTVYICESQINALTLWSWGYPAVALLGTGSYEQYGILKKCGVRNYVLCFDGDEAGIKGRNRFIKNMNKDIFISYKKLPFGKDVNDLSKEQFENLEEIYV